MSLLEEAQCVVYVLGHVSWWCRRAGGKLVEDGRRRCWRRQHGWQRARRTEGCSNLYTHLVVLYEQKAGAHEVMDVKMQCPSLRAGIGVASKPLYDTRRPGSTSSHPRLPRVLDFAGLRRFFFAGHLHALASSGLERRVPPALENGRRRNNPRTSS